VVDRSGRHVLSRLGGQPRSAHGSSRAQILAIPAKTVIIIFPAWVVVLAHGSEIDSNLAIGGRARWNGTDGKIYEWDSQHGTVEVYSPNGKVHLGEFDPNTGMQTKPGKPGRTAPKSLGLASIDLSQYFSWMTIHQ
jgi:hypothetical protein